MRMFLAADLPDDVAVALAALQEPLRRGRPPVSWTAPAAMHLTLVFLGEVDPALLPTIARAMPGAAEGIGPLDLRLERPGGFPDGRRPSVLWVGIGGDTGRLEQLQARLASALEPLGFPRERRPFRPHLTLGRVRREAAAAERERIGAALAALEPPPLAWVMRSITLYQSELLPGGSRYTPHLTVPLELPTTRN